jgi:hypothetical protein
MSLQKGHAGKMWREKAQEVCDSVNTLSEAIMILSIDLTPPPSSSPHLRGFAIIWGSLPHKVRIQAS